jgi:AI-2 transport protein TqsA
MTRTALLASAPFLLAFASPAFPGGEPPSGRLHHAVRIGHEEMPTSWDDACMTGRAVAIMLGLCTAVLVLGGLYLASSILAPVAFSLFVVAVVWPLQRALESRIPRLVALVVTLVVTLLVVTVLGYLVVWAFGTVGRWLIENALRFQALYVQWNDWLADHGILVTNLLVENFNAGWLIRGVQEVGGRLHGVVTFVVITFVFTALGLLEVEIASKHIASLDNREAARTILQASTQIADKFQKYMLVRSAMSVLTGLVVWAFTLLAGLELATAWGVIAFVLNYIPFIGPLVATVFPTLFALAQVGSWQLAVVVFVCLNLIQFLIGSYLEPRIAGAALSVSPFLVLFAVFFWAFLWGIAGAFIGVPIVIAALTLCDQRESTRWVATLLSGRERR